MNSINNIPIQSVSFFLDLTALLVKNRFIYVFSVLLCVIIFHKTMFDQINMCRLVSRAERAKAIKSNLCKSYIAPDNLILFDFEVTCDP